MRKLLGLLIPCLSLALPAGATTLITSPVSWEIGGPIDELACAAANFGTKDLSVKIEAIQTNGVLTEEATVVLPPNQSNRLLVSVGGTWVCRFTFAGSAKKVRAAVLTRDVDDNTLALGDAR